MFTNEWEPKTQNYKRFKGEAMIKKLARDCPNSYHVGLFIYCRGLEKEVTERKFYSKEDAKQIFEEKSHFC